MLASRSRAMLCPKAEVATNIRNGGGGWESRWMRTAPSRSRHLGRGTGQQQALVQDEAICVADVIFQQGHLLIEPAFAQTSGKGWPSRGCVAEGTPPSRYSFFRSSMRSAAWRSARSSSSMLQLGQLEEDGHAQAAWFTTGGEGGPTKEQAERASHVHLLEEALRGEDLRVVHVCEGTAAL
jgi:hypothetical protein